jgi:Domain of Unknown Function (DUF1080)
MIDHHKRLHVSTRLSIAILCLLLLIIGSSIFLVLRSARGEGNTPQGNRSTPTHGSTPTPTPTPATATDTATAQTAQVPLTPTPFFTDDFIDNSKGWYISDVAGYTRTMTESGLELTDTNHKPLIESLPTTRKFDDFVLTATLTLEQGDKNDSAGIYLRGDSNLDHDYRIDIFGDNTYAISKEYLGTGYAPQSIYLVPPTHISQLKALGNANLLTVIMIGPTMQLLINGSLVTTISDPDYTKGQIALFVTNGTTSQGVTALFGSIQIIAPPDQLPGSSR